MTARRPAWRRLVLGLPTVLGLAPRGFFIPCRYAHHAGRDVTYPAARLMMEAAEFAFRDVLAAVDACADALLAIGREPPPAPRWQQDWFPRLDAAAAYAMVRTLRPQRLVEVGGGHSTRFFARAVGDGGLATRITVVDPAPRAAVTALPVEHIRACVQELTTDPFADVAGGDMVAIDSSHLLMPGTDVDILLNRVLPGLPTGVLVHLHDIFLPDGYPEAWRWRGYNEQLGVAALLHGGGWRLRWSSHWVATRMAGELAATVVARLPLPAGAVESSLWIEKA